MAARVIPMRPTESAPIETAPRTVSARKAVYAPRVSRDAVLSWKPRLANTCIASISSSEEPRDRGSELLTRRVVAELTEPVVRLQRDLRDGPVDEPDHLRVAPELLSRIEPRGNVGLGVRVIEPREGGEPLVRAGREDREDVVPHLHVRPAGLRGDRPRVRRRGDELAAHRTRVADEEHRDLGARAERAAARSRVHLEEAHGDPADGRRQRRRAGRSAVRGDADHGAEDRLVVEPPHAAEHPCVRELRLLMPLPDRRLRREAARVEAVHEVELVAQAFRELAEDADPRLAPGARDDERVDVRAVDAVEARGLVVDVDDPDGHQDDAAANVELPVEEPVQVGLLDLDLPAVVGGADRVLDLDLRVEADVLGIVVPEEEDEAPHVHDRGAVRWTRERELAVAAECVAGGGAGAPEGSLDRALAWQGCFGNRLVGGTRALFLRRRPRLLSSNGSRERGEGERDDEHPRCGLHVRFHVVSSWAGARSA